MGYKLLYDRSGKLITERTNTDISSLKKYFTFFKKIICINVVGDCNMHEIFIK